MSDQSFGRGVYCIAQRFETPALTGPGISDHAVSESAAQPGGFLIAQQLAATLLIQALRLHLNSGLQSGTGWLFALADEQMAAAIGAMHDDPARQWTVRSLAESANMSRTIFTLKFKETVGVPPMAYLTRWRMLVAVDRLTSGRKPISVIAPSVGYESESAFTAAFKRHMGCSPRQYRHNSRSGSFVTQPAP